MALAHDSCRERRNSLAVAKRPSEIALLDDFLQAVAVIIPQSQLIL